MKSLIEIPKTMKALVLHEIGKLTLDEVPVEPLRPGTVLVKIKACGICSSDVERVFINGTYHFPTIPGHEFSGQIVAVGDDVDESLLGRRTCVFPMLPCFECPSCKKQQYAQCSHDEVPVEPLRPGTVLVKIKACGICSSDVERVFINGTYHFPTIPGHEFSGQIVAVGDDVDESLLGRRTCVFPMLPCFECPSCKKQQYAQCSHYDYFGSRRDGGYAEYLVVPTWNLVLFDDDLSYDVAAMCEPAAVGIHANGLANVQKGQSVLVIGTGMIGYVCAAFASQITDKVIMCGNSAAKLELAKKYGWETIALETDNFEERINALTDGEGVDVVMEVVGSNQAICNAVAAAGPNSTIVLVGNPKADLTMEKNLYWKILRKSITLRGSWNSSYNDKQNDWKTALDRLKGGEFDQLITHRFPMEESEEAFRVMRDRNTFSTKVMFVME